MGRRSAALSATVAIAGLAACGSEATTPAPSPQPREAGAGPILSGELPLLNGERVDLGRYRGDVVMVVNTASECGFTPQFEQLEQLYRERRSEGFVVLGFPADDVAGQEPRSDSELAKFCESNFGVSFPMFAKSKVVSEPLNPVFAKLGEAAGLPTWNFNKYLLDREGEVVERYDAGTVPDDPELVARIDGLLAGLEA